ncbi:MAG: response regulator [Spirochaetales bacterium]|nr:response regulator [Spirochaetales bacterium]
MKTTAELFSETSKSLRTILIVENSDKHIKTFKDIVTQLGFDCIHVSDLKHNKEIFLQPPFLCVIDCINYKNQEIIEFIRQYKTTNPYAVCVLSTTGDCEEQALVYLEQGAYDYLIKPFNPVKMRNLLARCLEKITLEMNNNRLQNQFYEVKNEAVLFSNMLSQIFKAGKRFIACNYLEELGQVIMQEFSAIFNIMGGSFFILENEKLQRIYSLDPGHTPDEIELPLKKSSFFGQVLNKREPLLVKNLKQEKRFVSSGWHGYKKESFLILPLIHNTHNLMGCVSLHDKENNGFTDHDKKLGNVLAGLSAHMIHNIKSIEELRDSAGKYKYFFEENPAADIIVTPQGRITLFNPSFERILGSTKNNDGIEYNFSTLCSSAYEWEEVVETIKEKRKVESYETEFMKHDGTSVYVLGNFHGRFDEVGELLDIKGVLIDITQRKRLEEQLNHSMKMEAVGRFAGSIAHDFNNLVTAILGYSDLCLRVLDKNSELHNDITEIRHAANMAAELTKKLLYFSKKQKIQAEEINLNRILSDMDSMLRRLLGEEIEFTTFFDPGLSSIKADRSQIEQVIMNLAVNARDAMPKGGKLLMKTEQIGITPANAHRDIELIPGLYAVLSIYDTGIGMDIDTKSRIFEPFFSTKSKDKGTGLGLSTVYAIMKKNKGIIKVESELGKGTRFYLYFPALVKNHNQEQNTVRADKKESAIILLVEDKEIVRTMVERVLEQEGYVTIKALAAEQALALVSKEVSALDMLITDINLPQMSGYDLADKLKQLYPDLKVIFTSGQLEELNKLKERKTQPNVAFLEKPFTTEELLSNVKQLLMKKK